MLIVIRVVDLWIVKVRNGQRHVEIIIQDTKFLILNLLYCLLLLQVLIKDD